MRGSLIGSILLSSESCSRLAINTFCLISAVISFLKRFSSNAMGTLPTRKPGTSALRANSPSASLRIVRISASGTVTETCLRQAPSSLISTFNAMRESVSSPSTTAWLATSELILQPFQDLSNCQTGANSAPALAGFHLASHNMDFGRQRKSG